ncbi:MAG TPA: hypothetical protein VF292_07885 [Rhodanobacteraceae bacterium]
MVLKASEQCPRVHWLVGDVLLQAGLGADIVNVGTNAPAANGNPYRFQRRDRPGQQGRGRRQGAAGIHRVGGV